MRGRALATGYLGSVLLAVGAARPAAADVTPPIWQNHSAVTTVLEVAEPFPDYVVFRVESYRSSAPRPGVGPGQAVATVIQWDFSVEPLAVAPGQPARVTGNSARRYSLYAVPRAAVETYPDPKELISAVGQDKVPGAVRLALDWLEPFGAPADRAELVLHYRLERTSDGTGVVFNRRTGSGWLTVGEAASRFRDGGVSSIVAGVAAALALVAFGMWWAGRRRARKVA